MAGSFVRRVGASSQSLNRFLVVAMAIGFAALIATGIAAVWAIERNVDHTYWVNHTYEVEIAIQRASIANEQAEASRRGYLLTGNPLARVNYDKAIANLPPALARIDALTRDNPRQQRDVQALSREVAALEDARARSNALVAAGRLGQAEAQFATESGPKRMQVTRALGQRMVDEERRLLRVRDADLQRSVQVFYVILTIAGLILAAVAITAFITIRRYTRDLAASRDEIRGFANSLEEQVAERTADLSRANEEIQRFAYIVSHDLRSPLVNVMGFAAELDASTAAIAELIDRAEQDAPQIVTEEARLAAREDLPEAIGFIRASTQKMDRLINAILKLSRQGRRVLTPEPVDVTALVTGAYGAIQQLFEVRGADFAIDGVLPDVVTDRLSLEQIMSNLIENAVKYLDPARAGHIVVRGRREGARVTYEVEDNGRGIAEADRQRVFDLFRRAGQQDQPGEGIGLAHVRALAYRLGGMVDLTSEFGRGTTFRITLPSTPTQMQDQA